MYNIYIVNYITWWDLKIKKKNLLKLPILLQYPIRWRERFMVKFFFENNFQNIFPRSDDAEFIASKNNEIYSSMLFDCKMHTDEQTGVDLSFFVAVIASLFDRVLTHIQMWKAFAGRWQTNRS